MHNLIADFLVLLLGDPLAREVRRASENTSSYPHEKFPLGDSSDINLRAGELDSHLLAETFGQAFIHSGSTAQHGVPRKRLETTVALHNGVVCQFVDTWAFLAHQVRLEEHFRAAETLAIDLDDPVVGQGVGRGVMG